MPLTHPCMGCLRNRGCHIHKNVATGCRRNKLLDTKQARLTRFPPCCTSQRAFADERARPITASPRSRNRRTKRCPKTPVAPARNIFNSLPSNADYRFRKMVVKVTLRSRSDARYLQRMPVSIQLGTRRLRRWVCCIELLRLLVKQWLAPAELRRHHRRIQLAISLEERRKSPQTRVAERALPSHRETPFWRCLRFHDPNLTDQQILLSVSAYFRQPSLPVGL